MINESIIKNLAEDLVRMHRETAIDLRCWPAAIAFVAMAKVITFNVMTEADYVGFAGAADGAHHLH